MAHLYKGHVVDGDQYPAPKPTPQAQAATGPARASQRLAEQVNINPVEVARVARELEQITNTVANLGPTVSQLQYIVEEQAAQKGYQDGIAKAQSELQQQLMEAVTILTDAQLQRREAIQANEGAIADLALLIARKVIGSALDENPELVARIVANTISELAPSATLLVKVNPADLEIIENHRPSLERLVSGRGALEIRADETVDRGGCLLVSPAGEVDARISTKLSILESAFAAQKKKIQDA